ncbi:hypothetical protein PIB30_060647 [Stylosanthes scabra]|uniref:Uncharacterized protein n=1 Tax=Stylosanthes scabra TaxID=79078 RepID=A0ABU6TKC3_9FABA|nr:hypothetical protein [Stylosanthes scabra]
MQTANLWSDYNPEVGHFTVVVNVKRDKVGLAALRYYEGRDGSREKELDISSDSSSSSKANVPVDVDNDSVEI